MTFIKGGIRGLLERFAFWVYLISAMATIDLITLAIFLIYTPADSTILLLSGIISGLMYLILRHQGYRYWHFREHENILETDYMLDFETEEEYDRWTKMKEILSELGTKDYSQLNSIEKRIIKRALEEIIDDADPTKKE